MVRIRKSSINRNCDSIKKSSICKILMLLYTFIIIITFITFQSTQTTTIINETSNNNAIQLFISNESKIFEIGLPKTGTTSLGEAFKRLHYKMCAWNSTLYDEWKQTENATHIIKASKHCFVFQDMPWNMIDFKLWISHYPNGKFILLERDNEEWVNSVERWYSPQYTNQRYRDYEWIINREQKRNKTLQEKINKYKIIINYFNNIAKKSQLLIMNLGTGDG
eukprot:86504_1